MRHLRMLVRCGAALLALLLCLGAAAPAFAAEEPAADGAAAFGTLMPVHGLEPEQSNPVGQEEPIPLPEPIELWPFIPDQPARPLGRTFYYGSWDGMSIPGAYDAVRTLQDAVGYPVPIYCGASADANGDGRVDVRDACYILGHPNGPWQTRVEVENVVYKPVIYLYPEVQTDVTVTLGSADALTCVYPAYGDGWRVNARPDGTLTGHNGREYYCLYYEADVIAPGGEDGFVVPRAEIADFLEQKLAILGLTEREAQEFIIYWLPQLTRSEYAFIRFAEPEAVEAAMPLAIDPAPDTVIRVWMQYQGLDAHIDVPAQTLTPAVREGFTAVEWGGMELPD